MCGIFGFLGKEKKAPEIILRGLKDLEYRGYDSWGIAVVFPSKKPALEVEKHVGKIGKGKSLLPKSFYGIGHTRWATHGGVTTINAHPHLSCNKELVLVHNGIVENYLPLRSKLVGHKFLSQTDTEVIVHLIEEEYKKEKNLLRAVKKAFLKLRGLNAIALLSNKGELVAVKNGTPLVLGLGKSEALIASDPSALLPHTKRVIFLEDNQVAAATTQKNWEIFDFKDKRIKPKIRTLSWKVESTELEGYRHFMIKEINEQPQVIKNIATTFSREISQLAKIIKQARGTFFIGCGSASYAALAGQYLFSKIAKLHINFSIGSEFNYLEHYLNKNSLVIAISQSGETIDVVEPVATIKRRGVKLVALTNVLGSTLYRLADYRVLLGAGPEKAVCATKSFISMVSILVFLSYEMKNEENIVKEILLKAANNVEEMLKDKYLKKIRVLVDKIYRKEHIYIIGRGLSYAAALEATLKLKEVPYIHSEGFAAGELKHGVIALIEKGTPVIVFAPNDETHEAIISNAIEIKSRGGYIIGIGPQNNEVFDYYLPTFDVAEASIIVNTVPAQLLAYFIALKKGLDPDMPRNLAKSVTVK